MLVTIDIPQESIAGFLVLCAGQDIEVRNRNDEGPAGGNPRFLIAIHSAKALTALGKFYWG
jgi:hypothetical protein